MLDLIKSNKTHLFAALAAAGAIALKVYEFIEVLTLILTLATAGGVSYGKAKIDAILADDKDDAF